MQSELLVRQSSVRNLAASKQGTPSFRSSQQAESPRHEDIVVSGPPKQHQDSLIYQSYPLIRLVQRLILVVLVIEALLKAAGLSETSWLCKHFSSLTWLKVAAHYLIGLLYLDGLAGLQGNIKTRYANLTILSPIASR